MNENYARTGQFFPDTEGVRRATEAVSHSDLRWFFQKYVAGTDEIPWDDFFRSVGLHLVRKAISIADPGFVATQNFDAAPRVSAIIAGSAAETAGLSVGDAILEINRQTPHGRLCRGMLQLCTRARRCASGFRTPAASTSCNGPWALGRKLS